jgi:hypothetical protein
MMPELTEICGRASWLKIKKIPEMFFPSGPKTFQKFLYGGTREGAGFGAEKPWVQKLQQVVEPRCVCWYY